MLSNRSITVIRSTLVAVAVFALVAGGCGSSTSPSTCGISPTNPEGTNPCNLLTVTIKNGVYSPNPVMVKVGQSVNWLNSDTVAHTATDVSVFDTGSIAPTSAADGPVLFNSVGTFNYHCALHANETASIVVTGSLALTSSDRPAVRTAGSIPERWIALGRGATVLLQLIRTHPILTEPLQGNPH
jgi:plastocyanin